MERRCTRAGAVPVPGSFAWAAWLTAAGCLLIGLGSGCGGDYSEKVQNWSGNKAPGRPAAELWGAEELAGTTPALTFCRPHVFTAVPMANGQGEARKAKPTIVDLPGLKLTCEAFEKLPDNSGNQAAFYFYIGSVPASVGEKEKEANDFKTKLGNQVADKLSLDDWVDFPVDSGSGTKTWRKLRYTGQQEFCVKDKDGRESFSKMPGVFEVYLLEESGSIVIVAWRAPLSLEPLIALDKMAQAVTGSVAKK